MTPVSIVVPTYNRADLVERLLNSLASQTVQAQVIVVDNGSSDETAAVLSRFRDVEVLRLERNEGFARAVNRGAQRADGDALVLLNNDCVCDPEFVEEIVAALEPAEGIVMAAAVLRNSRTPSLIDSAGMELDSTLLPFDYLNGLPVDVVDGTVEAPVGPSAAAAAFDREAFLGVGGFDEGLFCYWEDVDLVVRLRLEGATCALARRARANHIHSATLGSGSRAKNYLMGFGRAYALRKWRVLGVRRLGAVLGRELVICGGQLIVDGNGGGIRGRIDGFRAAATIERHPYPERALAPRRPRAATTLRRRARRRMRLLARAGEGR